MLILEGLSAKERAERTRVDSNVFRGLREEMRRDREVAGPVALRSGGWLEYSYYIWQRPVCLVQFWYPP